MELKQEVFNGLDPAKSLVEFVIKENIKRENILTITQNQAGCTLFYYA